MGGLVVTKSSVVSMVVLLGKRLLTAELIFQY